MSMVELLQLQPNLGNDDWRLNFPFKTIMGYFHRNNSFSKQVLCAYLCIR